MAENTASTAEPTDNAPDAMGGSAPRQAKNFWPSIKRLFPCLLHLSAAYGPWQL